jgi:hypothetical protein
MDMMDDIQDKIWNYKISINIYTHKKSYQRFCYKKTSLPIYSDEFSAICHHVTEHLYDFPDIPSVTQIMCQKNRFEENMKDPDTEERMSDSKNIFMFLPLKRVFQICPKRNIYCEIQEIDENQSTRNEGDGKENQYIKSSDVKIYHICLFQYNSFFDSSSSLKQIRDFMEECLQKYEIFKIKKNKISKIYEYNGTYEDEDGNLKLIFKDYVNENQSIELTKVISQHTEYLVDVLRPFIFNEFSTVERDHFQSKYKHFMKNFKMNIMIYGEPGTGKTHIIKAICQYLNRTIVKVSLSKIKKSDELRELIHTRVLNKEEYRTEQIVFVIEECDAESNKILVKRNKKETEDTVAISNKESYSDFSKDPSEKKDDSLLKEILLNSREPDKSDDSLDLKTILDTLDGIRELNGSVILFTTNHIENLDPAFIREGRMDLVLEFKRCKTQEICQLIAHNFKLSESDMEYQRLKELETFPDFLLSVSSIQNICFKYSLEKYDTCLNEIKYRLIVEKYLQQIQKEILSFYPTVPSHAWDVFDVMRKNIRKDSLERLDLSSILEEIKIGYDKKETWNICMNRIVQIVRESIL